MIASFKDFIAKRLKYKQESKVEHEEGWQKLPEDKFLFYAIVTHEVKSSINDEVFAPFTRINDGKMFIAGVKKATKIESLRYLSKVSNGTHLDYERYFYMEVTDLKIKNPPNSYFCADGEPHKSSEYSVELLPSSLTLIGKAEPIKTFKKLRSHI